MTIMQCFTLAHTINVLVMKTQIAMGRRICTIMNAVALSLLTLLAI